MKIRSLALCAVAVVLPLSAAACGGGKDDNNSGSRPSQAEIKAQVMKEAGLTDDDPIQSDFGDCVAEGIHASSIPNGVLRKLAAGEQAEVDADNKDDYEKIQTDIVNECDAKAQAAMADADATAPATDAVTE